jgi:hypothetical protein
MLRWVSIVVVALALVAAGCGGSDDESAATDETTVEETTASTGDTTTDETSTEETSTETSGTDTGAFNFASDDCQSLVRAYVGLSAAIAAASSGQDVTADIEKFSQYEDEVPEEIRADVQTIAAAYSTFLAKLKDIGYTPGSAPTAEQIQKLQGASASVATPEVQAAGERMNTWTTENCKS